MSSENPANRRTHEIGPNGQTSAIKGTGSFERLYAVLDEIGSVQGSQELYTAAQLKDKIDRVRSGELGLDYITSTFGLRDAVERIMQSESSVEAAAPEQEAAAEGIAQNEDERAFLEYVNERAEAARVLTPFVDRKLVDAGLITADEREALLKQFSAESKAGYARFSTISPERQEDIHIAASEQRRNERAGASVEATPVQEVDAAPEEDVQKLHEVRERLGIPQTPEEEPADAPDTAEVPIVSQEQVHEAISAEELEGLYTQIDDLRQGATFALYDKADWEYKDLSQQADRLQYKLKTYFTETPQDTDEMRQLLEERSRLEKEIPRVNNQKQMREQVREIERRIVQGRNT